jgi:hypothetical protein
MSRFQVAAAGSRDGGRHLRAARKTKSSPLLFSRKLEGCGIFGISTFNALLGRS